MNISKNKYELIIVIPFYNEGNNLIATLNDWNKTLKDLNVNYLFLLINDGSTDGTETKVEDLEKNLKSKVKLINKSNSGHGDTCLYGYIESIKMNCEWIFQIDSDGQCDPIYFSSIWKERYNHKFIFGNRKLRKDGFLRLLLTKFLALYISILFIKPVYDANVPYRLMKTYYVKKIDLNRLKNFYLCNIFLTISILKKFDIKWVSITFLERKSGRSMFNFTKIMKIGILTLKQLILFK